MAVICSEAAARSGVCPAAGSGSAGREQDRVGIGWFPVHRDPEQQAGGAGDLGQPAQQVLEQDVVGGQRDGLGQGGVQAGAGGQPLVAGGAVQAAGDRVAEPSGDVGVAGGAAGQQGVQVFQGPGVPAGQPPDLLQLVLVELVQGGQGPGQLHRLGLGQRPELPERQELLRAAGQGEPVPAGHQQPARPRVGRPGGQQPGQRLIGHRIPCLAVGAEVVLEVVQQHQHRHPAQDMAAQEGQPVRPAQVRPARGVQRPDHHRGAGVLAADQQVAAEGGDHRAEQGLQGQRPGQADQDPARVAVQDPGGDLGGQGGLAAPADPADHDPRVL